MDPRENNLPVWAKQLIASLRRRIEIDLKSDLVNEIARLRPQVELLKRRNEALTELLECAAAGKHKIAAEIVEIIKAYDLQLIKNDD